MAHKRAFSKTIIETDAFQDMSQTAQLLYFYLNMQADDDGFVGNPKRIMRAGGFAEDDFKVLLAKRFLLVFENGVVVIKHWLIHNTIRHDRYTKTTYIREKKSLKIKENKAYTDHWQPNGNRLATQDKIKEDKRKEDKIHTPDGEFLSSGYISQLRKEKRLDLQIIGYYFEEAKMDFPTKEAAEKELKRWLPVAKTLKEYPNDKLVKAFEKAKIEYPKLWKLSTVEKIIPSVK